MQLPQQISSSLDYHPLAIFAISCRQSGKWGLFLDLYLSKEIKPLDLLS
jgi:hypothetical protein